MVVMYSKLITITKPTTTEPVTILVECIKAEGFQGISIESLEGEYPSLDEFNKTKDIYFNRLEAFIDAFKEAAKIVNITVDETKASEAKIHQSIPLTLSDARRLADALNEALAASD